MFRFAQHDNSRKGFGIGANLLAALAITTAVAQEPVAPEPAAPSGTPFEETIKPTWETQRQARTYVLDVPAPRGQITDRNGAPLAQNKLSYNLTIDFPTPLRSEEHTSELQSH